MKHRFGETVAKAINTPLTNTLARTLLFPIPKTNGNVSTSLLSLYGQNSLLFFCLYIEWIPCIRLDYVEKEYVGLVRVSEIDRTPEYNENGSYKTYVLWIIVRDI